MTRSDWSSWRTFHNSSELTAENLIAQIPSARQTLSASFAWKRQELFQIGRSIDVHGDAGQAQDDTGLAGRLSGRMMRS